MSPAACRATITMPGVWLGRMRGPSAAATPPSACRAAVAVDSLEDWRGGTGGKSAPATPTGSVSCGKYGDFIGGFAVGNWGTISGSYATGDVVGTSIVGGLRSLGLDGIIISSYATGDVTGLRRRRAGRRRQRRHHRELRHWHSDCR